MKTFERAVLAAAWGVVLLLVGLAVGAVMVPTEAAVAQRISVAAGIAFIAAASMAMLLTYVRGRRLLLDVRREHREHHRSTLQRIEVISQHVENSVASLVPQQAPPRLLKPFEESIEEMAAAHIRELRDLRQQMIHEEERLTLEIRKAAVHQTLDDLHSTALDLVSALRATMEDGSVSTAGESPNHASAIGTSADRRDLDADRSWTTSLIDELEHRQTVLRVIDGLQPGPEWTSWSVEPATAAFLARVIESSGARHVVEAGSGVSTVVIGALMKRVGGQLITLEHDVEFADRTRALCAAYGVSEHVSVLHRPLASVAVAGTTAQWYSVNEDDIGPGIDVLFVDGPPASSSPNARWPALPLLAKKLADSARILLDDALRTEETEILGRWSTIDGVSEPTIVGGSRGLGVMSFERQR